MRCKADEVARAWYAALAVIIAAALIGQTALAVDADRNLGNLYSYFTIQSNILVLVAAVALASRSEPVGRAWTLLRMAGLVGITVTGVVYATAIGPFVSFSGIEWWYDKAFHYVVPIMAVIGFFAFRPRTRFDVRDLWFIVWPVVWLIYTLVRGMAYDVVFLGADDKVSHYPYDFIDVDEHGGLFVTVACVVITVVALALAWAYIRLSRSATTV